MEVAENKCVIYEFGKFVLDPKERTLFADGVPIHLPAKEFDTLVLLVEHNGHALAKDEMISAIWRDSFVEESNLAKQISRLRKLFNTDGEEFIETLPKHGYRFNAKLRRTLVDAEDQVILERRTVKRVTFALENDVEPERLALPPAKPPFVTASRLALLLVAIASIGFVTWFFRDNLFGPRAVIDPYAPVRLTDNPFDDTGPGWTRDGRIRFTRILSDNQYEAWIMRPDGTGQELIKMPEGKRIFIWSPDGQKIQYVKQGDDSKVYLANADGSGEILLPFRGGVWSADSKLITYHQRVSGGNFEVFVYTTETGKVRNVTNSDAFDADPSFSPDGKRVVFASVRDGNPEIYSINIDGTDLRRLTFDPKTDAHASFSPDGTQILFGSDREKENGDLYLMNSDGSGVVKVAGWDKSNETAGPGGWSPDGTKIVFYSDRNGKDDIYVVSAETVRPKLVLSEPDNDLGTPVYSPDGGHILYSRGLEDKTGELRIFDRDTQETSLVTQTERSSISARWSPDANWIVFSDRANGNSEIFRIRPDGSDLENLTKQPSSDATSAISPDGGQLVFWSDRGQPAGSQLWIMNFDGSDAHPLTPRKGWEGDAIWSPDGRSIVFVCDRLDSPGNLLDLCEINADGSDERRLLFHPHHDGQPAVSPDGKRIAFVARGDGNHELYLVNRDGSGLRRLTRDSADDLWPEWSPDGRTIVFGSNRAGKFAIYELEINDE
jgi:Tol biopolymer transport system component/DNA-binding winged helix-turn-helix (wHTH) protein